jgi:hypothetical protein
VQANLIIDVDGNNEDAIDRLLKVRDKLPVYEDKHSIIYALLSQLNPQKWENNIHILTIHLIF